jgi:hypothetical protein
VKETARALLDNSVFHDIKNALPEHRMDRTLSEVARGELLPDIRYRIAPLPELIAAGEANEPSGNELHRDARTVVDRLLPDDALHPWCHQPLARLQTLRVYHPEQFENTLATREVMETLPIPHSCINRRFRALDELDLGPTAVDWSRSRQHKQT